MPVFKIVLTRLDDDNAHPDDIAIFETEVAAETIAKAVLEFASRVMDAHRTLYMEHQRLLQEKLAKKLAHKK